MSAEPAGRSIALVSLLVRDYDEAIAFYVGSLGFTLIGDTALGVEDGHERRWVVVSPSEAGTTRVLLALATTPEQRARVGDQTGGRVALFLHTDDFERDHAAMLANGVRFTEAPRQEPYGTVAVFMDLYGTLWDLIQPMGLNPVR